MSTDKLPFVTEELMDYMSTLFPEQYVGVDDATDAYRLAALVGRMQGRREVITRLRTMFNAHHPSYTKYSTGVRKNLPKPTDTWGPAGGN